MNRILKNELFPMGNPKISNEQIEIALEAINHDEGNFLDKYDRNILHSIVFWDDPNLFQKFVDIGCSPNQQDKFGYLPFDYACDNCCYRIVDWLFGWQNKIENANPNYTRFKENTDNDKNNPSKNKNHPHQSIHRLHKICAMNYEQWEIKNDTFTDKLATRIFPNAMFNNSPESAAEKDENQNNNALKNKLLELVKVFVKWDANLFETDGTYYQGTPLFWAQRANMNSEPNDLIEYLEAEMENQLISGKYQPENPEREVKEANIVPNYKLKPSVEATVEEDLQIYLNEKEDLGKEIKELEENKNKLTQDIQMIELLLQNALDSLSSLKSLNNNTKNNEKNKIPFFNPET